MNSPPAPAAEATARDLLWAFAQQSLEHAILHVDGERRVTWASPGAAKVLGAEPAEIVGGLTDRFFVAEDVQLGIPEHEVIVARSQGKAEDNRWMQRADGSRFWASGLLLALRDERDELIGFTKILRNLTDMKMLLDTLGNRAASMAEANEHKNAAIATIAHELRNPLASIGMAAHLLQKQEGGGARIQSALAILARNVEFAERLVNDLQDASRTSARKLQLRPERVQLGALLQEAMETARQRAADPDREFNLLLPPGEPIELRGDRLRLQQVFVNLLGNAVKYTHDGGRVWIKATVQGPWLVVRVADDGIGIAPDMLEKIFQMFTQVSTPMTHAGMGIGLALVKDIVELHGGNVEARSDGAGHGSEFVVRLPLIAAG